MRTWICASGHTSGLRKQPIRQGDGLFTVRDRHPQPAARCPQHAGLSSGGSTETSLVRGHNGPVRVERQRSLPIAERQHALRESPAAHFRRRRRFQAPVAHRRVRGRRDWCIQFNHSRPSFRSSLAARSGGDGGALSPTSPWAQRVISSKNSRNADSVQHQPPGVRTQRSLTPRHPVTRHLCAVDAFKVLPDLCRGSHFNSRSRDNGISSDESVCEEIVTIT